MQNFDADQLDLIWVALRSYKREQERRGEKDEAAKAHELSSLVHAARNAAEGK